MADFSVELRARHTRIRNVPIAVTPEGFWCCPSPAVLQKTLKNQPPVTRPQKGSPPNSKASSVQRAPTISSEKRTILNLNAENPNPSLNSTKAEDKPQQKHKISVGFGQTEASDFKIVLHGKDGILVKMSVHRNVLLENSSYFAEKLCQNSPLSCLEIPECDDVEIYVETVGLMYCKDVKHRLVKQSVPRVLRILKVADSLKFRACVMSCLDFLEAVPWVGDEEDNVISYLRHLQIDTRNDYGISPLLRRVSPNMQNTTPNNTLGEIIELVLKSTEDRARREMKSVVSKLLKENSSVNGPIDICTEILFKSCQVCLNSLLDLFRQASEPEFTNQALEVRDPVNRSIALEADNLLWLLEILCDRHVSDNFVMMWAGQDELANLHARLPIMSRHLVSCITARIFVGVGKGEVLPAKDTRQQLIHVWLQPLIDDYKWLQHACRSFDRKVVEEGIGRTILTLPLEEQQSILLTWMGRFLKAGDACPNLQNAFEVWWRRTFVRPFVEQPPLPAGSRS